MLPPEHIKIDGFSRPVQPAALISCNCHDPCHLHRNEAKKQQRGSSNIGTTSIIAAWTLRVNG